MKLKSGYGLKEKIRDDRKLTLRLQWYHLTQTEVMQVKEQLLQMAQDIFQGQDMLFLGSLNQMHVKTTKLKLPCKKKNDFSFLIRGFVRTDESVRAQAKRIRENLSLEESRDIASVKVRRHPLFPVIQQQAAQLIRDSYGKTETNYVTGNFPVETLLCVRQRCCSDSTYVLNFYISVSAYALGYVLQDLLEKYKEYLSTFYKNTGLFAGYILYETKALGAHGFYHMLSGKLSRLVNEGEFLEGYEWAAYLSGDLVRQLTDAQLEELKKHADVETENNGLYYQTRCDITAFGLEQKRIYADIFQAILKPGFQLHPAYEIYTNKLQPADAKAYLLRERVSRYAGVDPAYYVGFFYQMKLEDTPITPYYDMLEEIELKD